jgi:hypothetical protein
MIKSQLRQLIRESIKELMNEQYVGGWNQVIVPQPTGPQANHCITWQQYQYGAICCDSMFNAGYNGTPVTPGFFTLGQGMMHPTPEQHLLNFLPAGTYPCMNAPECVPTGGNYGYKVWSQALYNYFTTHNPNLVPTNPLPTSCNNLNGTCLWDPGNLSPWGNDGGLYGSDGCEVAMTYTPPPPPSGGCDPNAPFPPNFNLASWTNTWTSLPNFSNTTNPNQPCNLICQRKNQWTSQLAAGGMGPKQTNMVSCKLEEAEAQYLTHNCATSNANNCP